MLKSLSIRNFVLIDHLDIEFNNDFSVITGETGAGKSIILGALSLVLGQRADVKSIKKKTEKCIIEAVFDIHQYGLEEFFEMNDLDYDKDECILRRELYVSGKSRAFINDSPVSLAIVKELGNKLIDIHSQHQNLLLGDSRFQLNVVDVMAQNTALLANYKTGYNHYLTLNRQLETLKEKSERSRQEEDYIRFQLNQLEEAALVDGEQEELEKELEMLTHAEEIKTGLYKIAHLLDGEEQGVLPYLKEAVSTAESLDRYYQGAAEMIERLRSVYIELNDLAAETDSRKEDIEFNPDRQEWVNERLNTIYSLQQKHHAATVGELLALQERYATQLQEITSFDDQIEELENDMKTAFRELHNQALSLSEKRKKAARRVEEQLVRLIVPLGMPNTRFAVDFALRSEPGPDGIDDICFMFSANKNIDLQPVAQTASGGEISRVMLCIKAMIAGFMALPTIIFDEVDTGVSGDIADKMGDIMKELGGKMQVITITHLPQIAAKGGHQYFVFKEDIDEQTVTQIRLLTKEERILEIARMLSGSSLTEEAIANARSLIANNQV